MSAPTDNPTLVARARAIADEARNLARDLEEARRDAGTLRARVAELERERDALKGRIAAGQAAHNEDRARADTLWRERDEARARTAELEGACDGLHQMLRQAVEALEETREVLALCDPEGRQLGIRAPEDEEVRALCERVGYGAVMSAASRLWRLRDQHGAIGAHTAGPCVGTVQAALEQVDEALATVRPALEPGGAA